MKFANGQKVTHLSTGNEYLIVGTPGNYIIEATKECAYAYKSTNPLFPNTIWIRPKHEMEDGRFL